MPRIIRLSTQARIVIFQCRRRAACTGLSASPKLPGGAFHYLQQPCCPSAGPAILTQSSWTERGHRAGGWMPGHATLIRNDASTEDVTGWGEWVNVPSVNLFPLYRSSVAARPCYQRWCGLLQPWIKTRILNPLRLEAGASRLWARVSNRGATRLSPTLTSRSSSGPPLSQHQAHAILESVSSICGKKSPLLELPKTTAPVAAEPVTEDELRAIFDRLDAARDIFRQNRELREVLSRRETETRELWSRNAELDEMMRKFAPLLDAATTVGLVKKPEPENSQYPKDNAQ